MTSKTTDPATAGFDFSASDTVRSSRRDDALTECGLVAPAHSVHRTPSTSTASGSRPTTNHEVVQAMVTRKAMGQHSLGRPRWAVAWTLALIAGFATDAFGEAKTSESRADEVFERWLDATVVDKTRTTPTSMVQVFRLRVPALNAKSTLTLVIDYENRRMIAQTQTDKRGRFFVGFVDDIAWASDDQRGARLLEGDDGASLKALVTYDPRPRYDERRHVGVEEVDGKRCDRIRLVDRDRNVESDWWFDQKTGLLHKMSGPLLNEGAVLIGTVQYDDYRPVQGFMVSYRYKIDIGPVRQEGRLERIDLDLKLSSDQFGPPKAVTILRKLKKRRARRRD